MARRFSAKLILASLALMPGVAGTAPANAQTVIKPTQQDLVLSVGRGQLVSVGGTMADVFVANDQIADVQLKSQRQLYIFGKSGGTTTVYASNAAGDIIWSANIRVGSNIDSVDQMLALAMPEAKIAVATMGSNTVLLTGTVAAPEDAAEAQRLVEAFMGSDTNVISRLKTATPLQVSLRVRIAEVSRNFTRSIGVNLSTVDATGGFRFGIGQGRAPFQQIVPSFIDPATGQRVTAPLAVGQNLSGVGYNLTNQNTNGSTLAGIGRFLGLDLNGALDLAEQDGLVTTLAEPNLVALSGETASFLAGGEFPIIATSGLNGSQVSFKKFGVSLSYTPVVLANGRISLRVKPEVSEISSLSVVLSGSTTPSLSTRMAETTVELGSGQSFMIAGLMQNNSVNNIEKAPGLGDVPILGNLFRSSNFRRGETELVIVVTPYLVKPIEEKDVQLPTDGFQSPTEVQRLLGNRVTDGQTGAVRPMATAADRSMATPKVGAADSAPGAVAEAQPTQVRREEKVATATPGFSFK